MAYETVVVSVDDGVARVTLNRPKVLNALDAQMFDDLEALFTEVVADDAVRVVLLTGVGEKAFAAGADIRELQGLDVAGGGRKARRAHAVFGVIENCGKPVIALVNGFALGGGCELSMACTFRIAADTAKMGQPEVKLGLVPGFGGTQRLPRLVGEAAAMKLLVTGEMIGAGEALRIGLVDEVVPAAELMARGEELAAMIAANAPLAVRGCMEAVRRGRDLDLAGGLEVEAELFGRLCGSEDKRRGLEAFLEKRKAEWVGK